MGLSFCTCLCSHLSSYACAVALYGLWTNLPDRVAHGAHKNALAHGDGYVVSHFSFGFQHMANDRAVLERYRRLRRSALRAKLATEYGNRASLLLRGSATSFASRSKLARGT